MMPNRNLLAAASTALMGSALREALEPRPIVITDHDQRGVFERPVPRAPIRAFGSSAPVNVRSAKSHAEALERAQQKQARKNAKRLRDANRK